MDRQEIMGETAAWMHARRWKEKLAKRRECEQSLFEHSLIELDVLLERMFFGTFGISKVRECWLGIHLDKSWRRRE